MTRKKRQALREIAEAGYNLPREYLDYLKWWRGFSEVVLHKERQIFEADTIKDTCDKILDYLGVAHI